MKERAVIHVFFFDMMKRLLFLSLGAMMLSGAAEEGHRVLISGCGLECISIVGADKEVEWTMSYSPEVSDAVFLENGNILHSSKYDGVREIKPNYETKQGGKVVWTWKPEPLNGKQGETHSCQLLPSGHILVGESHDNISFIKEIDRKTSKVIKQVELKNRGGAHTTFRQIRKTPQGTYLVTQQREEGRALEFSAEGKLLREFPDGRYVAVRLPNGNILLACGDAHRLIEVDSHNKIVWELKQNDLEGVRLGFIAGIQRLPNGNTLVTNWGGHGGAQGPTLLELTPEKKVVWTYDSAIKNRISSVQVLDKEVLEQPALR